MELTLSVLAMCIFVGVIAGGITFGIRKNKVRDEITATAEARWRSEERSLLSQIESLKAQIAEDTNKA